MNVRKITFLILLILFAVKVNAQVEPANYKFALNKFVKFYNADEPDSIFRMFSPELKAALPLDKFTATTNQLKQQLGAINTTSFVSLSQLNAVYKVNFKNATWLLNLALNGSDQLTGIFLKPQDEQPAAAAVAPDASVTESPIALKTLAGSISGTLTMPKEVSGKIPVVLIIAGTGPVDRNGNSKNINDNINANTYQLLAYALAKAGIASLRYDKHGVGQSISANGEKDLRFDDYSDDASTLIGMLNDDERFSKIIIAGHSEGALVGMLASVDQPIKGFISIEGPGESADKLVTEQLKSTKPSYIQDEFKTILDTMRKGKKFDNVDPALYYLARPSIQYYLMSWFRHDPTRDIKSIKCPMLIIQGGADLDVPVTQGQKLKSAKSSATLVIIRDMNYVLKDAPPDKDANRATYTKPDLPLNQELVTTITDFIKELK